MPLLRQIGGGEPSIPREVLTLGLLRQKSMESFKCSTCKNGLGGSNNWLWPCANV